MYRPVVHHKEEHSISYMQPTHTYLLITSHYTTINKSKWRCYYGSPAPSSNANSKSPRPQQISTKSPLAQTSLAKPEGEEM